MMKETQASAAGAIKDLRRIGAVEGVHYRVAPPSEDITRYPIAFDRGPLVELLALGDAAAFVVQPGFGGFAIVNAAGMDLVGCALIAGAMRDGNLPGEVAYLAVPGG